MTDSNKTTDDLSAWIDSLAGRNDSNTGLNPRESAVAQSIRSAVLAQNERDAAASHAPLEAHESFARSARRNAYLARQSLSQAPSATPTKPAFKQSGARWFAQWLPASNQARFALAAGLAAIAFVIPLAGLLSPPSEDPLGEGGIPGYRGEVTKSGMIRSANPVATAREISTRLRNAGAATRELEVNGTWIVEAKVPTEKIVGASAELASFGIVVPANGIVIIAVQKK